MKSDKLAPLVFVLTALSAMAIGWWTRTSLPISAKAGKSLSVVVFFLGMATFIWSIACLRKAFFGEVAPVTERLITYGPYRWVRHPLYLSMVMILLGIGLALRSSWGIIAIPVLFLPAVIYRARVEEKALSATFGSSWKDYVGQTKFLVPFVW